MPKSICRCYERWPNFGPGRCGHENTLTQSGLAFYLQSRRHLGFALKSEGSLWENPVEYAQELHHRGPSTTELALNWAQVPSLAKPLRRACRLEAVRHFARFWAIPGGETHALYVWRDARRYRSVAMEALGMVRRLSRFLESWNGRT